MNLGVIGQEGGYGLSGNCRRVFINGMYTLR